ncbi:MAG: IclR family transcriptional regulator [Arenicellales bacterium]|jgi:DNA-binding IclR family transcriptional regulator
MPKSAIQVIDRAARLVDLIAASDKSVPLKVLAIDAELHPSSAFRILASLGTHGYVERDEAGRYRLGRKLLQLGGRVQAHVSLREDARPIMEALRDSLHETINLTVRDGNEVVYIERAITNKRMMRVEQVIGSRAPLHVTAVGKLFLGEESDQGFDSYARETGLAAFTPHTITQPESLRSECINAVKAAYAVDSEEAEPGVSCMAVPVRDHSGQLVAAISISAPTSRHEEDWVPRLKEAGLELSSRLGYYGPNT